MGLMDLFSDKNEKKAAAAQKAGLVAGENKANTYLDTGLNQATGSFNQAQGYYAPLAATYNKGAQSYADALGLNGPDGNAKATAAFQTSPGYSFARDEALQGVMRQMAASGMLSSGNNQIALMDRANNLANQQWGSYLDRLGGYNPLAMQAAGAQAGIATNLGGLQYDTGQKKAGYGWQAETGKGEADANYQLSKNQTGANIFNALTGGLSLGAKLLGVGGFGAGGGTISGTAGYY